MTTTNGPSKKHPNVRQMPKLRLGGSIVDYNALVLEIAMWLNQHHIHFELRRGLTDFNKSQKLLTLHLIHRAAYRVVEEVEEMRESEYEVPQERWIEVMDTFPPRFHVTAEEPK